MNRFLCLIGLVLAVLHGAHSTVEWTNAVVCSAQGFKPTFVYNDGLSASDNQILSVKVILGGSDVAETGANAPTSWCQGSVPTNGDPVSQTAAVTVDSSNFGTGSHYTAANNGDIGEDFIPYQQATDGTPGTAETRCGGAFQHDTDDDTDATEIIKYEVYAKVIVRRKFRNTIIRTTQWPFIVRCAVTRAHDTLHSTNGFTVATALVDEPTTEANQKVRSTISYVATLKLYEDSGFTTAADAALSIDNDKQVYMEVEQGDNQELFKFHVDQCFSTVGSDEVPVDGNNDPVPTHKDIFYDDGCPADSTVVAVASGATKYRITMDSFYFPGSETTAVHFHCKITICLADSNAAECTVKTNCATTNVINENTKRRRRSAEEEGVIGSKMITSSQSVLVNQAQVFAPSCGNGFIYDRVLGGCSNENLVEINGIYLGEAAWDPAYANVTSDAFKTMAAAREYQLWVLLQVTRRSEYIRGVKIIRARQGSVILDVIIKHAASVSAEEAFHQMEQALKTQPSTTRVMNLLQIREEKTIELVPVVVAGEKSDTEKLILIVVVVVLFVVVFIAGVTLFKVRQARQQSSSTTTSFDNKGVDA